MLSEGNELLDELLKCTQVQIAKSAMLQWELLVAKNIEDRLRKFRLSTPQKVMRMTMPSSAVEDVEISDLINMQI